jgi:hypothetical protein
MVGANRFAETLDLLFAERHVADRELRFHLVIGRPGNGDAARPGERLYPVRDIDAVAMDVLTFDDDVPEIDADPEFEPLTRGQGRIHFRLLLLRVDGTAQGVNDTVELDQQAVAHGLDQTAAVFCDLRLEYLLHVALEAEARSLLVDLAQAAITNDIGDEDCSEVTLRVRTFSECGDPSLAQVRQRCHCGGLPVIDEEPADVPGG